MKNLYKNVNLSLLLSRKGLYDNVDYSTAAKYFAANTYFDNLFLKMEKSWEDFVCNLFGWDSYFVNPGIYNGSYSRRHSVKAKPLEKPLNEFSKLFNIQFDKKGVTLINKNLESALAN